MYQTECLFSFTVDTTPPTISGASIYMNGKYINSEINVKIIEIRKLATENNVNIFTSLDTVKTLLDVLDETTLRISTIDA